MAPRQRISKGSVKKSDKKFASRLVKDVMDRSSIVNGSLSVRNPKTLEKWISKMKLSVLRKISTASKTAFAPKLSSSISLREEISLLKEKIAHQTANIKEKAIQTMKNLKLSEIKQSDECTAYRGGRFDSEAEKIKNQFSEVAHHLASYLADITGCVESFSASVIATDTDWKQVSSQISTNMAGKTRSKAVKTVLDISPNKLPIDVLFNHLAKS